MDRTQRNFLEDSCAKHNPREADGCFVEGLLFSNELTSLPFL